MRDYEGSATIATSPDRLFGYLRDVRHLSEYLPKILDAKSGEGEEVAIVLDVDGHATEVHGWFRADAQRRMVQWGVPEAGYQGWLTVTSTPAGSGLVIHVQKPADDDEDLDEDADSTAAEIQDSLTSITQILSR